MVQKATGRPNKGKREEASTPLRLKREIMAEIKVYCEKEGLGLGETLSAWVLAAWEAKTEDRAAARAYLSKGKETS